LKETMRYLAVVSGPERRLAKVSVLGVEMPPS
jgi:hypothetical protein